MNVTAAGVARAEKRQVEEAEEGKGWRKKAFDPGTFSLPVATGKRLEKKPSED